MIQQAIHNIIEGQDLSFQAAKEVMNEIMSGKTTPAQMASFLTALRMKGETIDEITACATVMREKAAKMAPGFAVIDIVGTGGDEAGTFNISTTSAFVAAAGGVPVAKHGNRSVSSKSGAADVLERLGCPLTLTAAQAETVLLKTGMCFLFAQSYHSSMKYAGPVRKELGVRTIFNILGPLANPAGATMQLLGVYDKNLVEPLAKVLSNLGVKRGLVVCGSDGLDEATVTGPTKVCEIRFGQLTPYEITPEQFGLPRCQLSDLKGGSPEENAAITKEILTGVLRGPKRDIVILNSALSLYLGIDGCTIKDCISMAEDIIDSGKAARKLEEFIKAGKEAVL
ncbi:MAG TPA: anthranilate phosphoribosyltransferase [Candidatus Hungatella pullicola]|nr:anthranilate phosphoribosyltransferase [Candidatus Hungatella pullicola]